MGACGQRASRRPAPDPRLLREFSEAVLDERRGRQCRRSNHTYFGKIPAAKGVIAGSPGKQVWAIWTHRYYDHPDQESLDNVLEILRLVVEGYPTANRAEGSADEVEADAIDEIQRASLEAVIQVAQSQAVAWRLNHIKLWEPSPWVHKALQGIDHRHVERQDESVASGTWYGNEAEIRNPPIWINN